MKERFPSSNSENPKEPLPRKKVRLALDKNVRRRTKDAPETKGVEKSLKKEFIFSMIDEWGVVCLNLTKKDLRGGAIDYTEDNYPDNFDQHNYQKALDDNLRRDLSEKGVGEFVKIIPTQKQPRYVEEQRTFMQKLRGIEPQRRKVEEGVSTSEIFDTKQQEAMNDVVYTIFGNDITLDRQLSARRGVSAYLVISLPASKAEKLLHDIKEDPTIIREIGEEWIEKHHLTGVVCWPNFAEWDASGEKFAIQGVDGEEVIIDMQSKK